jgi:hypothetical protein
MASDDDVRARAFDRGYAEGIEAARREPGDPGPSDPTARPVPTTTPSGDPGGVFCLPAPWRPWSLAGEPPGDRPAVGASLSGTGESGNVVGIDGRTRVEDPTSASISRAPPCWRSLACSRYRWAGPLCSC